MPDLLMLPALQFILEREDKQITQKPEKLRAYLSDLCGSQKREINLILQAVQAGIPAALQQDIPLWSVTRKKLAAQLCDDYGITSENAEWVVDTWAVALGVAAAAVVSSKASSAQAQSSLTQPTAATRLLLSQSSSSQSTPALAQTRPARAISVPTHKKNPKDDADMVFIPAGEFTMGSNDLGGMHATALKPVHKVMLDGYYISRTPVTVAQYLKFCDETRYSTPSAPSFNPNWEKRGHPIVNVSYNDALAYCAWAGVKLPSEAQWEKAARGVDGRPYPWGDAFDRSKLWASKSTLGDAHGTKPVGSFPSGASPFGVLDMAGNVWQWCSDWYDPNFYSSRLATERNPENQSISEKSFRVLRGGSWFNVYPLYFHSAYRLNQAPDNGVSGGGFRCVSGL